MLLNINKLISLRYFLKKISKDVFRIAIFSCIVGIIARGNYLGALMIPTGLIAIIGTAISLLLAFRTSQSYDRWWEARIIWGAIVNDSRTLIRQLILFLPEGNKTEIRIFIERHVIWCLALSESLRKVPFSAKVQNYITKHQIKDSNIANGIITLHCKHLKLIKERGDITEFREVQVDETLTRFCNSMGGCERIKNTIFPVSYGKLIHFLIYLFALLLPFSLTDNYVILKTILTAIIPLIFIIIERTAILMQDPFENAPMDTPMTKISLTIEANLYQMIDEDFEMPIGSKLKDYYVL